MKKLLVTVLCAITALNINAQVKPENIKSIIVMQKDSAWYAHQTEAWRQEVKKNPTDETAWRNYFEAAWYKKWYDDSDTTSAEVFREMGKAIPNTYTYYFCGYRGMKNPDQNTEFAEKAIKLMPAIKEFKDFDTWTAYAALTCNDEMLSKLAKEYYESGIYSPDILQYNYNEMQGMDDNSIYIGNGDAILIPKWLLQYGKNVHKDKTIVCISFLAKKEYRDEIFKRLSLGNAPEMPKGAVDQKSWDEYIDNLIDIIVKKSNRTVYFSPLNGPNINSRWEKNLYNEGLTLRYSDHRYDNMAVKRRNVESRYLLEYLEMSFQPSAWTAGSSMSLNYAVMLSDLLPYYKKYSDAKYKWLLKILVCAIDKADLPKEKKAKYLNLLKNDVTSIQSE